MNFLPQQQLNQLHPAPTGLGWIYDDNDVNNAYLVGHLNGKQVARLPSQILHQSSPNSDEKHVIEIPESSDSTPLQISRRPYRVEEEGYEGDSPTVDQLSPYPPSVMNSPFIPPMFSPTPSSSSSVTPALEPTSNVPSPEPSGLTPSTVVSTRHVYKAFDTSQTHVSSRSSSSASVTPAPEPIPNIPPPESSSLIPSAMISAGFPISGHSQQVYWTVDPFQSPIANEHAQEPTSTHLLMLPEPLQGPLENMLIFFRDTLPRQN
ncbi:hypothetical protein BDZ94DRAFT_84769 [Collybia nuda]|uniref:Uncharacterized protein n=1 Tax=Collybia nuda TaxID=64659 RepID=A0A9P5YDU6_9AGAR|nr:hypothetical protein BDZ94DRAFT_84769 [Collybia nuda]